MSQKTFKPNKESKLALHYLEKFLIISSPKECFDVSQIPHHVTHEELRRAVRKKVLEDFLVFRRN